MEDRDEDTTQQEKSPTCKHKDTDRVGSFIVCFQCHKIARISDIFLGGERDAWKPISKAHTRTRGQ